MPDTEFPYDPYDCEGMLQINSFPEWEREGERFKRMNMEARGRRFNAYRSIDKLKDVVRALPADKQRKNEIQKLLSVALRMILVENDGGVSSEQLRTW